MTAAQAAPQEILQKGQFAKSIGVSPARVSQYIAEGKIFGAALVGDGREQRINATIARDQLRARLDPAQMTGNGLTTRLAMSAAAPQTEIPGAFDALPFDEIARAPALDQQTSDPIGDAIRQEKLSALKMDNRRKAVAEAEISGRLVDADDVKVEMRKIAREVMAMAEGALPEIANATAARFQLPARDVLHLMRTTFAICRASAAQAQSAAADTLPRITGITIAGDDAPAPAVLPIAEAAE